MFERAVSDQLVAALAVNSVASKLQIQHVPGIKLSITAVHASLRSSLGMPIFHIMFYKFILENGVAIVIYKLLLYLYAISRLQGRLEIG